MYDWIELSIFTACLSLFIEFLLREGNPLGGWIEALEKMGVSEFWQKPLGKCVICFNVWISLSMLPLILNESLLHISLYFVFSNFLVRYFYEKIT